MSSTTGGGYGPSVPVTNGHSTVIPESGVEIWSVPPRSSGTIPEFPSMPVRIYPVPQRTDQS